jgi:hypothetical protein
MHASCFQTPHWGTCADLSLTVSFLSDPDFRTQPLWIHTLATSESVSPLESTLTKFAARVSKHAALTPVESALTKTHPLSPLESALTKKGVGGGGYLCRRQSCRLSPSRVSLREVGFDLSPTSYLRPPPVTAHAALGTGHHSPVTNHQSLVTITGHQRWPFGMLSTLNCRLSTLPRVYHD